MQRLLPGLIGIFVCVLTLSLSSVEEVDAAESSTGNTELRWVSPSRTSTPDRTVQEEPPSTKVAEPVVSAKKIWTKPSTSATADGLHKLKAAKTSQRATESSNRIKAPTTQEESPFGKWLIAEDLDTEAGKVVEVSDSKTAPDDSRVAIRLFRGRSQARDDMPRSIPKQTMHPTERQVDDRRRPQEPPAKDIPEPDSLKETDGDKSEVAETPLKPLTRSQQHLRTKLRRVLAHYYKRPLNTRDRSPWEIMHGILAYEVHSKVLRGGPQGEPVTAVGWICFNQPCKKRTLMYINDEDELRVRVGPALQGHRGQLLAMLAQSKVSANYPMRVEGHDLTVNDLIEMEKRTCYPRSELTFKLLGLMHYLPSDAKWMNDQGMQWDLPKIVREEARQSLRDAACGGTHRLSGLTLAYKTREARGEPVDGAYVQAKRYVMRHKNYAYRLQNGDGSFSTEWFRGPGNEDSIDRKLKTTGHILEWLLYASEERDLKSSRITRATNYLTNIMYNNRNKDWEAGPLGHAIHALLLYDRLVFVPHDQSDVLPMADNFSPENSRSGRTASKSRSSSRQSSSGNSRQARSSRARR